MDQALSHTRHAGEHADGGVVTGALIALDRFMKRAAQVNTAAAERLGIGPTDFRALVYLSANGGASAKELTTHLDVTPGAGTGVADRLVAAGLLERSLRDGDRRALLLSLTAKGRDEIDAVGAHYAEALVTTVALDELPTFTATLDRFGAALVD